ncbi:zf-TFIIB domain-containing protein [Melittangium boletus]|uniref:Uncharacterized protein n=1 Tax=Melittangium boletus DSM 14713 TaxID=1294270 RepID=A0A250ISX2_9BACT|nr:zf-TFIIB domain-containing protein [Melittangium boletus]ATB34036.1 hypothetical protein MEBOL_007537 [Melittangium boletus DSM 14713]
MGGETPHSCVECRILLTPAQLGSGAPVEVCSACHGLLIDETELAALGIPRQAPPPLRAPPPVPVPTRKVEVVELNEEDEVTPTPGVPVHRLPIEPPALPPVEAFTEPVETPGTFGCVLCRQRKSLREGQAFRDGLACRACMDARARG